MPARKAIPGAGLPGARADGAVGLQVRRSDEQVLGIEMAPTLPNRGKVTLSLNFSPLKDANAHTQGITIVVDDLTEKKRLEAQRRLFERMVSPAVIDQLMALAGRCRLVPILGNHEANGCRTGLRLSC